MVLHRSGAAAGPRQRPDFPLRQSRPQRRRPYPALQPVRRLVGEGRQRLEPCQRLCHRLSPEPLVELHLLCHRSRPIHLPARRPVRAGRPAPRLWLQRGSYLIWRMGRPCDRVHARPAIAPRSHRQGQHLSDHRTAALRDDPRRPRRRRQPRPLRRGADTVARQVPQHPRPARRLLPLRCEQQSGGQFGQGFRPHPQSENGPDLRPLGPHRVLRERRLRLPQQRRPRYHHHGQSRPARPGFRHGRRSGDPAGSRQILRVGPAQRPGSRAADFPGPVASRSGVGVGLRRRCRHYRGRLSEPAGRRRMGQLLDAALWRDRRCRPGDLAGPFYAD